MLPLGWLAVAAAGLTSGMAGVHLIERREMSASLREDLVAAARKACAAEGHDVAVAAVDTAGTLRLLKAGDDTPALSIEAAIGKARTAALLRRPTAEVARTAQAAPAFEKFVMTRDPRFVLIGGGVPVMAMGELVGAIGVGGAPGPEADERCAAAALADVAGKLGG